MMTDELYILEDLSMEIRVFYTINRHFGSKK